MLKPNPNVPTAVPGTVVNVLPVAVIYLRKKTARPNLVVSITLIISNVKIRTTCQSSNNVSLRKKSRKLIKLISPAGTQNVLNVKYANSIARRKKDTKRELVMCVVRIPKSSVAKTTAILSKSWTAIVAAFTMF